MKAFRITSKDQYVQDINLNRGTYTFHAWVFAMGSNYSIGLKTQAGTWLNFNMADQIKAQEWRKVKITFTIYEPCVQFSLMNTFASEAAYVIVVAPMLEEGTNAGTQKPNELDLDESIGEGNVQVLLSNEAHVFAGTEDYAIPTTLEVYIHAFKGSTPVSLSVDDITIGALPLGLTAQKYADRVVFTVSSTPPLMVSPSGEVPITVTIDGKDYVRNFSYAISFKGADGTAKDIRLEASTQIMRKMKDGTWNPSTPVTVTATAINTTISKWEYSVNGGTFSTTPPIGVTRSGDVVSINPNAVVAYALYTIRASDGTISDTLSVIRLEDGADGADGDSAVTLLLSNESHTFAGSATAALAGSVNTTILAFKGTQQITPISVIVNTSDLPTGMSRTIDGSVITFTVTTSMTSSSGVIPITVVVDGKTFVLQFSYSIAFKGTDGLSKGIYLNAAIQVIKYNAAGTPTPATNFTVVGTAVNTTISTWEYSVNGGSFSSTVPAGVSRSGNTVTISPTTVTFNTLSIRASDGTISDTITIAAVRDGDKGDDGDDGDGIVSTTIEYAKSSSGTTPPGSGWTTSVPTPTLGWYLWTRTTTTYKFSPNTVAYSVSRWGNDGNPGLPGIQGPVVFQKEWVQGDTHRYTDTIKDYIYVRGTSKDTSYWYTLTNKEERTAGAPPTGGSTPSGYTSVNWLRDLAVQFLIAEEANLANFIFKQEKLISIKGKTYNGTVLNYGEYIDYNFANTVSQPAVDSTSWTDLPSGTIYWVRYKKNTDSTWTVKQIGTGTGQWTLQFATAPEGATWYSSYSSGRYWARAKVGVDPPEETDYGLPFKITLLGEYDFIPNIVLDGKTGKINGVDAEITGIIHAIAGTIGGITINENSLGTEVGYGGDTSVPSMRAVKLTPDSLTFTHYEYGEMGSSFTNKTIISADKIMIQQLDEMGNSNSKIEIYSGGIYKNGVLVL